MESHTRCLHTNLRYEAEASERCRTRGFDLRITNEGHHWQLAKEKFLAKWWPSIAKLVINQQWNKGCHCHDFRQALEMIERVYAKPQRLSAATSPDSR